MKKLSVLFVLIFAATVVVAQSLVSMSPNSIVQGSSTIVSTITGSGTLFQNGSPPNSIVDVTISGPATYTLFNAFPFSGGNINVTDDEHADVDVTLPINVPIGSYNLSVTYYDCCPGISLPITLTLPNAFTVLAPDGYVQGTFYWDVNQNGVKDASETGISNAPGVINPGGLSFYTDANGNYSYPLMNGNYTVNYVSYPFINYLLLTPGSQDTISFAINNGNSTGNNFPLNRGLTSVYPDSGWLGQNLIVNVYSDIGIFRPANITLSGTRLVKTQGGYQLPATQITYLDTNHIVLKFTVPSNIGYLGNYNLYCNINSVYTGIHQLPLSVRIVNPPILLSGIVFHDTDSDGVKDASESGIPYEKLLLMPDSTFAFSDVNGNYFFGTSQGTKTISIIPSSAFYLAPNNVPSYTSTVSASSSGFNFGLQSIFGNYACRNRGLWGGRRCNTVNTWHALSDNRGNNTYDGWVYFVKSPNITFGNSTPAVTYINGDTAAWNFTNLLPFHTLDYKIDLNLPSAGSQFTAKQIINAIDGSGTTQCSSIYGGTNTVTCAFDPNDKAATPEGVYAQHYTLMGDTLDYLIRFQNTGNDTAFTVVVRDTLDADLDLSSFNILASSHTMNTELNLATRVLKFTFNNILLPDSNVNEPESHGFIRYTIKAKTGLPNNTLVTNDADIYFDFNLPVITNETFNTMVYVIPVGISEIENNLFNVTVVPNPFENFASVKFDNPQHNTFVLNVYGIDGKLIETLTSAENAIALTKEKMNSGLYLFDLTNKANNQTVRGKFVVE